MNIDMQENGSNIIFETAPYRIGSSMPIGLNDSLVALYPW